jgi:succinate dehydrogenase / fumarate reductase cytochrome b subunit
MTLDRDRRHFLLRRLHSLSGIVPIGAYLLIHIFLENAFIFGGAEQWNAMAAAIGSLPLPLLLAAEVLVLWGPILFHGLYGVVIAYTGDTMNTGLRYEYRGSYLYVLQRITGILALGFIGFHVYTTRLSHYFYGTEIDYALMHDFMTDPVFLGVYLVGVSSAVFHFTNGIWTFCITWGITVGPQAQRLAQQFSVGLFALMWSTSMAILWAFR